MPSPPARQRYTVAKLLLSIEASDQVVQAVTLAVGLPEPPREELNELGLIEYIKSLRPYAERALTTLNQAEVGLIQPEDQLPAAMRIAISVLGPDYKILGTIIANGKSYGPRGNSLT